MAFNKSIEIEGKKIGPNEQCYVIAEGGVNHFGDLKKAFLLVDAAADAGADAFKTQHFKTDVLVSGEAPAWQERLRSKELSDDDLLRIRDHCIKKKITFLCTAHDEVALEFLIKENISALKIGSGEVGNWDFIAKNAKCCKPTILSVGMYTEDQIFKAISIFEKNKNQHLAVLHCHTSYPSKPQDINLLVMKHIQSLFDGPVGYSDHTIGTAVPLAAVALGANILEKHITIDKNIPNAHDWIVSCDPAQLRQFITDIRSVETALGNGRKALTLDEKQSLKWARKSLAARHPIPKGSIISDSMVSAKRPGTGISPAFISTVVGRMTAVRIETDQLIMEDMLI